jgi:hypothetical protein
MFFKKGFIEYIEEISVPGADKKYFARMMRNQLIEESDWTQLTDNVLSEEEMEQWVEYRQALRDIPQQPDFPENIIWPAAPSRD